MFVWRCVPIIPRTSNSKRSRHLVASPSMAGQVHEADAARVVSTLAVGGEIDMAP
jgi:hypothetical protein